MNPAAAGQVPVCHGLPARFGEAAPEQDGLASHRGSGKRIGTCDQKLLI